MKVFDKNTHLNQPILRPRKISVRGQVEDMNVAERLMTKAIIANDFATFSSGIKQGYPPDSAMFLVVNLSKGLLEFLRRALEFGANLDAKNSMGRTVLHEAIFQKKNAYIEFLFDQTKLEVNTFDSAGMSPLMLAVESANILAVVLCIHNSCNPFLKNANGHDAL